MGKVSKRLLLGILGAATSFGMILGGKAVVDSVDNRATEVAAAGTPEGYTLLISLEGVSSSDKFVLGTIYNDTFYAYSEGTSSWGTCSDNESEWKILTIDVVDASNDTFSAHFDNNYLKAVTTKWTVDSTKSVLTLLSDGSVTHSSGSDTYYLRYNYNNGNGGLRWYDKTSVEPVNFYKVPSAEPSFSAEIIDIKGDEELSIYEGTEFQFTVDVLPEDATADVAWKLEDAEPADCAVIDPETGLLTANKPGATFVTAYSLTDDTVEDSVYLDIKEDAVVNFYVEGTAASQVLGEPFNAEGLRFFAEYENAGKTEITDLSLILFNKDTISASDTSITATYKGKSVVIEIPEVLAISTDIINADSLELSSSYGIFNKSLENGTYIGAACKQGDLIQINNKDVSGTNHGIASTGITPGPLSSLSISWKSGSGTRQLYVYASNSPLTTNGLSEDQLVATLSNDDSEETVVVDEVGGYSYFAIAASGAVQISEIVVTYNISTEPALALSTSSLDLLVDDIVTIDLNYANIDLAAGIKVVNNDANEVFCMLDLSSITELTQSTGTVSVEVYALAVTEEPVIVTFTSGTVSATLTITISEPTYYSLASSIGQLVNGAKIVFGSSDKLGCFADDQIDLVESSASSSDPSSLSSAKEITVFTVIVSSSGYAFATYDGKYLAPASSSSTNLSLKDSPAYWDVSVSDGVFTVKNGTRYLGLNDNGTAIKNYAQSGDYTNASIYVEDLGSITPEQSLEAFAIRYLRWNEELDGSDTGACRGENGYYAKAKAALQGEWSCVSGALAVDTTGILARIQAWAIANGEVFEVGANGISTHSFGNKATGMDNPALIAISCLSLAACAAMIGYAISRRKIRSR